MEMHRDGENDVFRTTVIANLNEAIAMSGIVAARLFRYDGRQKYRGRRRVGHPALVEGLNQADEFQGIGDFQQVVIRAKLACFVDIRLVFGGGKYQDRQFSKGGLRANPLEDVEAGFLWHVDVEQHEAGEWETGAVSEAAIAGEVIKSLLAVRHGLEGIGQTGAFESEFKEDDVTLFVLRIEDGPWLHERVVKDERV
jgi:hypothetical protein